MVKWIRRHSLMRSLWRTSPMKEARALRKRRKRSAERTRRRKRRRAERTEQPQLEKKPTRMTKLHSLNQAVMLPQRERAPIKALSRIPPSILSSALRISAWRILSLRRTWSSSKCGCSSASLWSPSKLRAQAGRARGSWSPTSATTGSWPSERRAKVSLTTSELPTLSLSLLEGE